MRSRSGGFFVVEIANSPDHDELVAQVMLQGGSASHAVAEIGRQDGEMLVSLGEWTFPVEEFMWAIEAAKTRLANQLGA